MSDRTDWRHVLPVHRFEMWILRMWLIIATFGFGFGAGIFYCEFKSTSNFQGGAKWMQEQYTTPGKVIRVDAKDERGK